MWLLKQFKKKHPNKIKKHKKSKFLTAPLEGKMSIYILLCIYNFLSLVSFSPSFLFSSFAINSVVRFCRRYLMMAMVVVLMRLIFFHIQFLMRMCERSLMFPLIKILSTTVAWICYMHAMRIRGNIRFWFRLYFYTCVYVLCCCLCTMCKKIKKIWRNRRVYVCTMCICVMHRKERTTHF